jgi:hypothetical protein
MLEIKNKKTREEIKNKYCYIQLPPPQATPPPEPATPPPQAPQQQQNTYATSSLFQRIIFHFVCF